MPLLFTDSLFLEHDTGRHPECADRLRSVTARLEGTSIAARYARGTIQQVSLERVLRVHEARHVATVREFAERGGGRIEADTVVSPRSFEVAMSAAGAAVAAVDAVLRDEHRRACCLIRPPGHHATPDRAMGFCLLNNAAIAARHAQDAYGLRRVLIVDWDVHHGNGTQDVFYEDADVGFFSAHRWPFYPGTGDESETGTAAGLGTTFNLPLEFGISRREYHARFERMLADAVARCRPELIVLSAGFDAHHRDPIGSLGLETEDFGTLTNVVVAAAEAHCDGRLVSLLEGGYDLEALADSVLLHLDRLSPAES